MARGTSLVDLGDPIGTAVRLVRLVRGDLDRLLELAERVQGWTLGVQNYRRAYRWKA